MKFFYEYKDAIQRCEEILHQNFTKLYNYAEYRGPSVQKFNELDEKYANMKTYFDAASENVRVLKKEYHDLTEHYLELFERDFAGEFPNYAERQEPLRLKLIETIFECQNLQDYFENVDGSDTSRKVLDKDFSPNGRNSGAESSKRFTQPKLGVDSAISQNGRHLKHATVSFSSSNVSKSVAVKKLESRSSGVLIALSSRTDASLRFKDRRKSIICDICGKHFINKKNLDRHSVIHEGLKPFICSICDKSFARKDNLANHIKLIHESYRYCCSQCDRSFLRKATKLQHEQIAHS